VGAAEAGVDVLPDGTCLALLGEGERSWGERRSHVTVRVIEYRIGDGAQTIRLLTDLHDPDQAPAGELAELYHRRPDRADRRDRRRIRVRSRPDQLRQNP
jgi:hypothetical protein